MENASARVGRPKIGGPFLLTDQDGKEFSEKDLLGKWSMVYVRFISLSSFPSFFFFASSSGS